MSATCGTAYAWTTGPDRSVVRPIPARGTSLQDGPGRIPPSTGQRNNHDHCEAIWTKARTPTTQGSRGHSDVETWSTAHLPRRGAQVTVVGCTLTESAPRIRARPCPDPPRCYVTHPATTVFGHRADRRRPDHPARVHACSMLWMRHRRNPDRSVRCAGEACSLFTTGVCVALARCDTDRYVKGGLHHDTLHPGSSAGQATR